MRSREVCIPRQFDVDKVAGIDAGIGFINIDRSDEREAVEKIWLSPVTTYWFKSVYTEEDTRKALADEMERWKSVGVAENFVVPMLKPPLSLTREEMLERFNAGGFLTVGVYDLSPGNELECRLVGFIIINKDTDERIAQLRELPDAKPVFDKALAAGEEPLVLEISVASLLGTKRGLMSQAGRFVLKGVIEKLTYEELSDGGIKTFPVIIAGYVQQKPKPEWLYPNGIENAERVNTPAVRFTEALGGHYAGEIIYDEESRRVVEQELCRPDRCYVFYNLEDVAKAIDARVWDDLLVR